MRSAQSFRMEGLENRQYLAGVTMMIHGNQGNITGWITAAADAIEAKLGKTNVSEYVMKVGLNSQKKLAVLSMTNTNGVTLAQTSNGEMVVKVDWTDVDDGSQSTTDVGAAVANYMLAGHGTMPALSSLPLHLIGHSRGASMVVAISEDLGKVGVQVDQDTFLDPHPVGSYFGFGYNDHDMDVYSNVVFADDYWRTNGGGDFTIDPNGQSVDGTHQGNLNNSVQKDYIISAHNSVTAYYQGTIDLKAVSNIDGLIMSDWYGTTTDKPARSATGYYFSRIDGGARPADGLSPDFGGAASRKDVGESGSQWGNITSLKIPGGTTLAANSKVSVHYQYQDRDGGDTAQFFIDTDTNPFNGAVQKVGTFSIPEADDVTLRASSVTTAGLAAGNYYLFAKISDAAGHYRYSYSRRVTVAASSSSRAASSYAASQNTPAATSSYATVASTIFSSDKLA